MRNSLDWWLGRAPFWSLVALTCILLLPLGVGWVFVIRGFSNLTTDVFRTLLSFMDPNITKGIGVIFSFLSWLWLGFPLVIGIAGLIRPYETVTQSKIRLFKAFFSTLITIFIQWVIVPIMLGTKSNIEICVPLLGKAIEWETMAFILGLIEVHSPLLVMMIVFLIRMEKGLKSWKISGFGVFIRFIAWASTICELIMVSLLPMAVRWWPSVEVCPHRLGVIGEECAEDFVYGFEVSLCRYPIELVVIIYLNLMLVLAYSIYRYKDDKEEYLGRTVYKIIQKMR